MTDVPDNCLARACEFRPGIIKGKIQQARMRAGMRAEFDTFDCQRGSFLPGEISSIILGTPSLESVRASGCKTLVGYQKSRCRQAALQKLRSHDRGKISKAIVESQNHRARGQPAPLPSGRQEFWQGNYAKIGLQVVQLLEKQRERNVKLVGIFQRSLIAAGYAVIAENADSVSIEPGDDPSYTRNMEQGKEKFFHSSIGWEPGQHLQSSRAIIEKIYGQPWQAGDHHRFLTIAAQRVLQGDCFTQS